MARKIEPRPARKTTKSVTKQAVPPAAKRRAPAPKTRARKGVEAVAKLVTAPEQLVPVIEQVNRRYYDAFQSLNIEDIARIWWHDEGSSCIHPGWDVRHGWLGIKDSYEDIFRNTKSIRFALGDVRVHLYGEFAYISCVENLVSEEGESGDYLKVLCTEVVAHAAGVLVRAPGHGTWL
jgi:ketosteroid isomerase-like protein